MRGRGGADHARTALFLSPPGLCMTCSSLVLLSPLTLQKHRDATILCHFTYIETWAYQSHRLTPLPPRSTAPRAVWHSSARATAYYYLLSGLKHHDLTSTQPPGHGVQHLLQRGPSRAENHPPAAAVESAETEKVYFRLLAQ